MDLAADFSVPLPMMVIAEMLGVPVEDRPRFTPWNDVMLSLSFAVPGGAERRFTNLSWFVPKWMASI